MELPVCIVASLFEYVSSETRVVLSQVSIGLRFHWTTARNEYYAGKTYKESDMWPVLVRKITSQFLRSHVTKNKPCLVGNPGIEIPYPQIRLTELRDSNLYRRGVIIDLLVGMTIGRPTSVQNEPSFIFSIPLSKALGGKLIARPVEFIPPIYYPSFSRYIGVPEGHESCQPLPHEKLPERGITMYDCESLVQQMLYEDVFSIDLVSENMSTGIPLPSFQGKTRYF